tara:strand:+ start:457 stop:1197 length:741 start_codon:yes stop_codon:yes gene_type:complete
MKLELKDRVYVLKSQTTPLSYMLISRNTKRKPLLYFDEEQGSNRALRYARNQKSPFEDEQDNNAILEPIVFEDGFLTVPKNNPVLQKFLSLHPGINNIFEEVNTEKDASKEVSSMDAQLDAEMAAKELDIEMVENIARLLMGATVDKLTSSELRRDVRLYARQNPIEFLEMVDDPMVRLQGLAKKALDAKILTLRNGDRDVYFNLKNNKKKMITVPFDETPSSAISAFLQSDEGVEVMKMLEKKVN